MLNKLLKDKFVIVFVLFAVISLFILFFLQRNMILRNCDYGYRHTYSHKWEDYILVGLAMSEYAYQYGLYYNCSSDAEPYYIRRSNGEEDMESYWWIDEWTDDDLMYAYMVYYGGFRLDDYLEEHTVEKYVNVDFDAGEKTVFINGKVYIDRVHGMHSDMNLTMGLKDYYL